MRETLLALYELQKIDKNAYVLTQQAEEIPRKIHELEHSLEGFRSELGVLNTELETLRGEQREIEAKNAEEGEKHRKWKTRLHDIKSPREYQALSREVELGERHIRESEERILELMSSIEERQKEIADKTKILRGHEGEVSTKVRILRARQTELSAEAEAASQGREVEEKKLPARVVKRYSQVRKQKNGIAVALVKDGTCTGCNMRLRPQQEVELLRCSSWESCPNCNRLLVHANTIEEAEQPS